jgi:uncharacterized membrane protein
MNDNGDSSQPLLQGEPVQPPLHRSRTSLRRNNMQQLIQTDREQKRAIMKKTVNLFLCMCFFIICIIFGPNEKESCTPDGRNTYGFVTKFVLWILAPTLFFRVMTLMFGKGQ